MTITMTAVTGQQTIKAVREELEILSRDVNPLTAEQIENIRANGWDFHEYLNS